MITEFHNFIICQHWKHIFVSQINWQYCLLLSFPVDIFPTPGSWERNIHRFIIHTFSWRSLAEFLGASLIPPFVSCVTMFQGRTWLKISGSSSAKLLCIKTWTSTNNNTFSLTINLEKLQSRNYTGNHGLQAMYCSWNKIQKGICTVAKYYILWGFSQKQSHLIQSTVIP